MTNMLDIDQWMVAWNPATNDADTGAVKVGPWPIEDGAADWTDRYLCNDGCCWTSYRHLPQAEKVAQMLIVQLAVIDAGIDPKAAHREFMKIDAYRDLILAREHDTGTFYPVAVRDQGDRERWLASAHR